MIPKINEAEIKPISDFIASIDKTLPVCFLAFRPNFILESHPGAAGELMRRCVEIAKESGLENVHWSGTAGLPGEIMTTKQEIEDKYKSDEAKLAASYASAAGCSTHPRNCGNCRRNQTCEIKRYVPRNEETREIMRLMRFARGFDRNNQANKS